MRSNTWFVTRVISLTVVSLAGVILAICMGLSYLFDLSEDHMLRTAVSPDDRITALVVADDCGATCGCKIRVDLRMGQQYTKEVYRSYRACDAELTWLSATELVIVDVDSTEYRRSLLDMRKLGFVP
jgi:hypothetical protein